MKRIAELILTVCGLAILAFVVYKLFVFVLVGFILIYAYSKNSL